METKPDSPKEVSAMYMFFRWLGAFIDIHWGDLNGMFLIICGLKILIVARGDATLIGLGQTLLFGGAAILRPKAGNGQLLQAVRENHVPKN